VKADFRLFDKIEKHRRTRGAHATAWMCAFTDQAKNELAVLGARHWAKYSDATETRDARMALRRLLNGDTR
jgi:hypothetical protein